SRQIQLLASRKHTSSSGTFFPRSPNWSSSISKGGRRSRKVRSEKGMSYVVCGRWAPPTTYPYHTHLPHTIYHIPSTTYHLPHTTYRSSQGPLRSLYDLLRRSRARTFLHDGNRRHK